MGLKYKASPFSLDAKKAISSDGPIHVSLEASGWYLDPVLEPPAEVIIGLF